MSQDVYRQLLEVMQKRGGRYAGMNIPEFYTMVEELFTPEEAEINNDMPRGPFTAEMMSEILKREKAETERILESMANKGLCMAFSNERIQYYMSSRFIPGILEAQFMRGTSTERDKYLARLIHDYESAVDAVSPLDKTVYPVTRVITVDRTIAPENTIHTHDQVQAYIDQNEYITVAACYCRHAAALRDEDTHGMPIDVCMQFGPGAQFAAERLGGKVLTKEEAREVIKRSEKAGLIHLSQNMAEGIGFICNCDRWHCQDIKSALSMKKPGVNFNSGFDPVFDPDRCIACEICLDRCPPEALSLGEDDVPVVNFDRCFGCAVCATGCEDEAISMVNKPDFRGVPKDKLALKEALKAG